MYGTLVNTGVEVKVYAYATVEGETVIRLTETPSVPDELTPVTSIQDESYAYLKENAPHWSVNTTIQQSIRSILSENTAYTLYKPNTTVFVVSIGLRPVYQFNATQTEDPITLVEVGERIPPIEPPEQELIGELKQSESDFEFTAKGLKMKLLLKTGRKKLLTQANPQTVVDYENLLN